MLEEFRISASDAHIIFVRRWRCDSLPVKGVVHFLHGMSEHSQRYDKAAKWLVSHGYHCYAHDHRGYGYSITASSPKGHFFDDKGWDCVVDDVFSVNQYIHSQNYDLPVVLLGHSMGSFIAQSYAIKHGDTIRGLVLSGSDLLPKIKVFPSLQLAKFERAIRGKQRHSPLLQFLSFSHFNRAFKPNRTAYDWLSRDHDVVDQYASDPLCGWPVTTETWVQLLSALQHLYLDKAIQSIDTSIPILSFSGDKDPVGQYGTHNGLAQLDQMYKASNHQIQTKLYPDGRHEMLNEINREEVFQDLLAWLDTSLSIS